MAFVPCEECGHEVVLCTEVVAVYVIIMEAEFYRMLVGCASPEDDTRVAWTGIHGYLYRLGCM